VDTEFRKDNKAKVPATEQNWTNQRYEVVAVPKRTSGRVSVREVGESKNPVIRVRRSEVQRFSATLPAAVSAVSATPSAKQEPVEPKKVEQVSKSHRRDKEAEELRYAMRHLAPQDEKPKKRVRKATTRTNL
jgi:hypothetical protein